MGAEDEEEEARGRGPAAPFHEGEEGILWRFWRRIELFWPS